MTRLLYSVGPAIPGGFGLNAVSWQEIRAWMDVTNFRLTGWMTECLSMMSRAYVGEYNQASKEEGFKSPPWMDEDFIKARNKGVAHMFRKAFKSYER